MGRNAGAHAVIRAHSHAPAAAGQDLLLSLLRALKSAVLPASLVSHAHTGANSKMLNDSSISILERFINPSRSVCGVSLLSYKYFTNFESSTFKLPIS